MQELGNDHQWAKYLNGGESMAGGNTTAHDDMNTAMKGPGSKSVYPRPETTDTPDLEVSPLRPDPTTLKGPGSKKAAGAGGPWTQCGITTGFKKAGE